MTKKSEETGKPGKHYKVMVELFEVLAKLYVKYTCSKPGFSTFLYGIK